MIAPEPPLYHLEAHLVLNPYDRPVLLPARCRRITVTHTVPHTGDGPADFSMRGTQLLLVGCSVTGRGNTWTAVTRSRVTGPIVLLDF
jgi:hypothetical protein